MGNLTMRQLAAAAIGTALCSGVVVAFVAGDTAVAIALAAGLNLLILFGVVQLGRRVGQALRALESQRRSENGKGSASPPARAKRGESGRTEGPVLPPDAATGGYWKRRENLMYYKYVIDMARALASDAESAIDVGSRDTPMLEELDWVPRRDALDRSRPYHSHNVRGIKCDFLQFHPSERYDFALCLQVLEHVPEAAKFGMHLREVAHNVLVSVPFMWEEGVKSHVNDPVSREKLVEWMGGEPDYEVLVAEPFIRQGRSRRLIAYYHSQEMRFSLVRARSRLSALKR